MHDIDRVLNPQEMFNEAEFEASPFGGAYDEAEFEFYGETTDDLDESTLAAELLSVGSEQELELFIGSLLKNAAKGVTAFAKSKAGRAIGGALKQAAKAALPTLGATLGSAIPIPGVGTAVGNMAGKALASTLELETGMDVEDSEFEVAQNVVRLAKNATKQAMKAPPGANPNAVAAQAVKSALRNLQGGAGVSGGQSGRWVRRGNKIVLFGV